MKVLVAEDSDTQRKLLAGVLRQFSVEPIEASSGSEALDFLLRPDGPRIALIDWEMPGFSGIEVCRKVREATLELRPYLILVTGRTDRKDVVEALEAGADDYLTKPPHPGELQARVQVGMRNLDLQRELKQRIVELEGALHRLDVVGAVAAQTTGNRAPVAAAHRAGTLTPQLEALDALRGLPERFASVVANFKGNDDGSQAPELWAHLSLALPGQAAWLDATLEVSRGRAAEAFNRLSGQSATTDQALLDGVSDVLTLVMRGFQQQLEESGVQVLKPISARSFVGSLAMPASPHCLQLAQSGWTLQVLESAAPVRAEKFGELTPGSMLINSLTPPKLPDVEVLAKGTLLKVSYLTRAGSFFRGEAAQTEVSVMEASKFALERRGV